MDFGFSILSTTDSNVIIKAHMTNSKNRILDISRIRCCCWRLDGTRVLTLPSGAVMVTDGAVLFGSEIIKEDKM